MPHRQTPPEDPRAPRRRKESRKDEPQSFGEEGRFSSDQARYYGADTRSFDSLAQHKPSDERPAWRQGRYDAGRQAAPDLPYDAEDALARGYYSLDGPHGGQEYGIEPHGYRQSIVARHVRPIADAPEAELGPYGDPPIDPRDPGVREFGRPADYAYHPGAEAEFELEYLDWRETKLAALDREYAAWRAEQQRKYDTEYRAFRGEWQARYDRGFAEWRNLQDAQDPLTAPATEEGRPPEDRV
ncbi:hypothetical protein ASE17_00435 [Phenylobacterium sp. Root77]|jgi:hypothetical protein|uniref:hypothetical protein n=1 Tax=unclassified Phenylobacterium TaxID=2640670 RepID=UPI0006F4BCDA|nr:MULTISPECIES: hypothetical protein [unclassified Phenylobacterium]KQW71405.1 hypothetical protein ASC73_04660 [Phenylobacterium sp. Root1277]KQW94325.1 hypothetical protein ASC79_00805 [Phenylobacterium sp. Root1290]KRC44019.1 hypothetical protein ASE17_00435 [Phenylobacterium sp. Root77]